MDLATVKFGLGIAVVVLASIFFSFALYWKVGEAICKRRQNAGKDIRE